MAFNHPYIINGNFHQAISPLDRGFAYGDGVFRTMTVRNNIPQHWPQHYQKLAADCAVIGIVCPSAELLISDFHQLFTEAHTAPVSIFKANTASVAKIIITRGEAERGYALPAITSPMRVIVRSALQDFAPINYTNGVQLHVCDTRLAAQPKLAGIKHLNRLENVIARMEWQDEAIFDGLLMDNQDNVIEGTMSNIFARYGSLLLTPDLRQCGVAGITRDQIISFSTLLGLSISITELPLARLMEADEIIICNSLYGAFQVNKIEDRLWEPQALAKKIRNLLSSHLTND